MDKKSLPIDSTCVMHVKTISVKPSHPNKKLSPTDFILSKDVKSISDKVIQLNKNLLPIDFLMMGESYHNNHHKYGGRANFGKKWHEFDPTYPIIFLFNSLQIIHLKKDNDLNYM